MKIYAQMDPKSHPKINLWAIRGPTFEIFGSVLRNAIFNKFWGCAKSRLKMRKVRHLAKKAKVRATFGRVGGRGGRLGNLVLLVLGQTLAEHLTRLAPPSKDGVSGFKGYRLCRRPLLNRVLAILCNM